MSRYSNKRGIFKTVICYFKIVPVAIFFYLRKIVKATMIRGDLEFAFDDTHQRYQLTITVDEKFFGTLSNF